MKAATKFALFSNRQTGNLKVFYLTCPLRSKDLAMQKKKRGLLLLCLNLEAVTILKPFQ